MNIPTDFEKLVDDLIGYIQVFNEINGTDFSVEPWSGTERITISFPTKKERWATKMASKAQAAANRNELTIDFQGRATIVYSKFFNRPGIAIRSLSDRDDTELGIAIAYCRATGTPIPDYVL